MTSDYPGVQTHNAFDLLDDEAPAKQPKAKEVKEEPKKDTKRTSDRDRPTPRVEGGDRRVDGGERGRGGGRGGARGAGRGGRGRGGGGGGGGEGGRERKEFDAHVSRTGKTHAPKKDGAGKFNEGSVRDTIADGTSDVERRSRGRRSRKPDEEEAPAETKAEIEASTDAPATDGTATEPAADDKPAPAAAPEKPAEPEEPPTRTYDEFLASKTKLEADLAIQRREAQNDESQFKAVKVIAKTEEKNPYIVASAAEEKEKAKKVKKDKAKHISLDEFTSTANGGNARGGFRGRGGRGGRGRGDARSLAVTETNFPALAPKEKK